jgi:carbon monoxide dehydrogenase subunit G
LKILSISRTLHAPIGEVWALTSAFGAIRAWMPAVARVSLVGAGIGAERTVSGTMGSAVERLVELDPEQHRVRYAVNGPGLEWLKNLTGQTRLESLAEDRTRLEWTIEASEVDGDVRPLVPGFSQFMEDGIAALARFLEVRVE